MDPGQATDMMQALRMAMVGRRGVLQEEEDDDDDGWDD